MDVLLTKALQRNPEDRFQRASEMVRRLTEISYESSIVATPLEIATAVERVLDRVEPSTPAPKKVAGVDELIRKQLKSKPSNDKTGRRTALVDSDSDSDGDVPLNGAGADVGATSARIAELEKQQGGGGGSGPRRSARRR